MCSKKTWQLTGREGISLDQTRCEHRGTVSQDNRKHFTMTISLPRVKALVLFILSVQEDECLNSVENTGHD